MALRENRIREFPYQGWIFGKQGTEQSSSEYRIASTHMGRRMVKLLYFSVNAPAIPG
jgi:hypothetical protein